MKKKNEPKTSSLKQQSTEEIFTKAEVEELVADLTTDLQKVQAEFINYKRRAEEERVKANSTGKEQAANALLPVLDSIDRAISHEPSEIINHPWVKGINSMANQLQVALANIGLEKFGQPGDIFDPNLHDAVSMDQGKGEVEVIAEVLQTGYKFGETIIRPAMVRVTKK